MPQPRKFNAPRIDGRGVLFSMEDGAMSEMDRRSFAAMLPGFVAMLGAAGSTAAAGQAVVNDGVARPQGPGDGLAWLESGVFAAGPESHPDGPRRSRTFLKGMLKAGDIQIEMHETWQAPGTPHEAIGHHLHNEIWLVKEGVCELMTNGVTRRMEAGEVGLCCAGDEHWVKNAGETACSYFVVTVGPRESRS
jgi:quercetin dioxygenase-like cupin family protein